LLTSVLFQLSPGVVKSKGYGTIVAKNAVSPNLCWQFNVMFREKFALLSDYS